CRGEGVDRVVPNIALLAWLEQQTGKGIVELFADEDGDRAWHEIHSLIRAVLGCVDARCDDEFKQDSAPATLSLQATPRGESAEEICAAIVPAAVLGLFPASHQGLIRDTREMLAHEIADGPIESFVR